MNESAIVTQHQPGLMPALEADSVDAVVTDPPYPDYHSELYQQTPIDFLNEIACRQLVFWSTKVDFVKIYIIA